MHPSDPRLRLLNPPLAGTERRPRGLFVDRWGTLLELPPKGYVARFQDASFVPHAVDLLFRAARAGWWIYLIGNEDAVARGLISDGTWARFEEELLRHLAAYGVRVRRSYACLDHPEWGKGSHRRDSVFLLPNTGAMYHAMQHDGLELRRSWVIGDGAPELVAGWRCGCRLAGVRTGLGLAGDDLLVEPDLMADDLAKVLGTLVREDSLR